MPFYTPVPLDSIAPAMQDAVVAGEDNNFFAHGGIDYLALLDALGYRRPTFSWSSPQDREALWAVLPNAWSRRDKLRGASTISQQLAKNLYLSASRNPLRKLKEAVITWRLERALSKRRIMELYLNVVELGDGVWGVEPASQLYFKHSARQLSREQAAELAGALPFPLRSNPGYRPGRMRWRQQLILRRMGGERIEVPKVDPEEAEVPEALQSVVGTDSATAEPESTAVDTTVMIDSTPAVPLDSAPQSE
jgi:monofunctional biosynthetic peptidoglycan transglycosylase